MHTLALSLLVALSSPALAGSTTGTGATIPAPINNEFVPMIHVGVDGGAEFLVGSNARAFAPAPMERVWADVQDMNSYRVELAYAFSRHALSGTDALFNVPPGLGTGTGFSDIHQFTAGSKVMLLAKENASGVRKIDPWISTSLGIAVTRSLVQWDAVSEPSRGLGGYIVIDGGGGVDFRPIKAFSAGVSLLGSVRPAIRRHNGKYYPDVIVGITPAINLTVHI